MSRYCIEQPVGAATRANQNFGVVRTAHLDIRANIGSEADKSFLKGDKSMSIGQAAL